MLWLLYTLGPETPLKTEGHISGGRATGPQSALIDRYWCQDEGQLHTYDFYVSGAVPY